MKTIVGVRLDGAIFRVLGLPVNASLEEVREAYKDLVKVWHPDRFANHPRLSAKAEEKLKEINNAYERLLSDFGNDIHSWHRPAASAPRCLPAFGLIRRSLLKCPHYLGTA